MKKKDELKQQRKSDDQSVKTTVGDAEMLYRTLFTQSPDGILIIGTQGEFIDFNEAAHRRLGYSREEFTKLRISDIDPVQNPEEIQASLKMVLEKGSSEFEVRHRTKQGEIRDVFVITQLLELSGKKVFHTIWRDITERKRMEHTLRASESFVKNILDAVDEGFLVIDKEYKIIAANKAYLGMVNESLENVIGRQCHALSHHINKPCFEVGEDCAVQQTFLTGEPFTATHTHTDNKGEPLRIEIKSFPLKDEVGNVTSAIEVLRDVTRNWNLEQQLRYSQKMEAIGRLAGGIAHDFNNILTAIIGYGNILKMKISEDDPLRHYLQRILDSSDRATSLTLGLLAYSRKKTISPEMVDLNIIVMKVKKLLERLIDANIEMQVIFSNEQLTVFADTVQIEQVLMNLATNAREAMPGGGCLTIRTELAVLDHEFIMGHHFGKIGMYALITVSDTGPGFDDKSKDRIFEPFFTTKEVGQGTGLGLSIAYGIVKQHNGFITCDSAPKKGTTFRIYLPLIKGEPERTSAAALLTVSGGTGTVLVGEDDAAVRMITKEILTHYGYTVIEAVDGADVIDRFMENQDVIQLLLLDIELPKKNGKEVYVEIRRVRPDVKALFMSGYTGETLQKMGIDVTGLDVVAKPISPTSLMTKVKEAMGS